MRTTGADAQKTLITYKKCRQCKKDIPIRFVDEYAYKDTKGFYCSWTCLQKSRDSGRKVCSASDAAAAVNVSRSEVVDWIRAGLLKAEYKGGRGVMYKIAMTEVDRIAAEGREAMRQRYQAYLKRQREKMIKEIKRKDGERRKDAAG